MQLAHAGRRAELEDWSTSGGQGSRWSALFGEVVRMWHRSTTSRGVQSGERGERGATGWSDVCLLQYLCLFHCCLTGVSVCDRVEI